MNILKAYFGTPRLVSQADTRADGPEPDPDDIWCFTDPDAREAFQQDGKLKELEHDIRFEVMRGEPWLAEELDYKREIQRLLSEVAITDKGSYWFTSPFPTVYRAVRDGMLKIGERDFPFESGDDIVFQCRMTREMNHAASDPVLISKLQPTTKSQFCGEMGGAIRDKHGM